MNPREGWRGEAILAGDTRPFPLSPLALGLEACGWRLEQAEFACQASLPGLAMPSLLPCETHTLGLVAWGGTPGPQSSCCSFQTLFPWASLPVHFLTPPYSSHLPALHTKVPGVPHQA